MGAVLLKRWVCPLTSGHFARLIRRQGGESNESENSHQLYTNQQPDQPKALSCAEISTQVKLIGTSGVWTPDCVDRTVICGQAQFLNPV